MPGSPVISSRAPPPSVVASRARRKLDSCSWRPTRSKSAIGLSRRREPVARPTAQALTGRDLPFTMNGSSAIVAKRVSERSSTDSVA